MVDARDVKSHVGRRLTSLSALLAEELEMHWNAYARVAVRAPTGTTLKLASLIRVVASQVPHQERATEAIAAVLDLTLVLEAFDLEDMSQAEEAVHGPILDWVRVLTVGNMYPPHHYGGYELVWRSAVEHLLRRGHEVRVLTTNMRTASLEPDPPHVYRELRWHLRDGEFQRLGVRARAAMARHNHRVLAQHLDELGPGIVGWWSMGGLSPTLLEEVRRRRIPAVAFVHDDWLAYGPAVDPWLRLFCGRRHRLTNVAQRLAGIPTTVDFSSAATYWFVSEFTRERALGLGLGLQETGVAHSGIHPDFLDATLTQPWQWRVLYVGRIDSRKGVDTVVEALVHLPAAAGLTIVGGGDPREEQRLRSLAVRLGVDDRIEFAGQRNRDDLLAVYANADAVVFPVRWHEPWGLVPLEAMARGCPVVATGRGGSGEYLRHQENCLLFPADDPQACAGALRRLAADPDLRATLRQGGLDTAGRHTAARFDEAVERAILEKVPAEVAGA